MKRVLIVDDEPNFLRAVTEGLAPYSSLSVETASNGAEALGKLAQAPGPDLLITDLNMPVMDGFELLAHLTARRPPLPTMVITAFGSSDVRARLERFGDIVLLEKPLDIYELTERIFAALTPGDRGYLPGVISLATFLQLLQMERKTCHLTVTAQSGSGELCLSDGQVTYARCGELRGDVAAQEIIAWGEARIAIDGMCRNDEVNVTTGLTFLIMDSMRRKDELEARRPARPDTSSEASPEALEAAELAASRKRTSPLAMTAGGTPPGGVPRASPPLPRLSSLTKRGPGPAAAPPAHAHEPEHAAEPPRSMIPPIVSRTTTSAHPLAPSAPAATPAPPPAPPAPSPSPPSASPAAAAPAAKPEPPEQPSPFASTTKEQKMAIETHLQSLRDIRGYRASAVMNFTGEVLVADSADQGVDLALVGATFNDIFRSAHEASRKIGLDATRETVIKTPKGLIVMACSGTDAKIHFHVIAVLGEDGNQALLKMRLDSMLPKIMSELG